MMKETRFSKVTVFTNTAYFLILRDVLDGLKL